MPCPRIRRCCRRSPRPPTTAWAANARSGASASWSRRASARSRRTWWWSTTTCCWPTSRSSRRASARSCRARRHSWSTRPTNCRSWLRSSLAKGWARGRWWNSRATWSANARTCRARWPACRRRRSPWNRRRAACARRWTACRCAARHGARWTRSTSSPRSRRCPRPCTGWSRHSRRCARRRPASMPPTCARATSWAGCGAGWARRRRKRGRVHFPMNALRRTGVEFPKVNLTPFPTTPASTAPAARPACIGTN